MPIPGLVDRRLFGGQRALVCARVGGWRARKTTLIPEVVLIEPWYQSHHLTGVFLGAPPFGGSELTSLPQFAAGLGMVGLWRGRNYPS